MSLVGKTKIKLDSPEFRRGFREGLNAPSMLYSSSKFPRSAKLGTSVAAAWSEVGRALREAERRECGEAVHEPS
jgi:hypothetical protein